MTLTDAKLNANQANAQKSTGPQTTEGKQRSKLNATRHGLTGQVRVTTEEDKAAYDKHCHGFFEDLQPRGATEKHLVQTLADKQWQMHHASALLESIQILGHAELEDKIDVEHPEIHAALTAGLVASEKCRQLDLISRYASRLQRDYRTALKDLQALQAIRKQHEQQELEEAALLRRFHKMDEIPFNLAEFGFVLPLPRIAIYIRREEALEKARIARDQNFNRAKYHAAVASAT